MIEKFLNWLKGLFTEATPADVIPIRPIENVSPVKLEPKPQGPWSPKVHEVKSPRKIRPEMRDLIIKKLMEIKPGEFRLACETKNARALVHLAGLACASLNIREIGGNNKGKLVGYIQAVIGSYLTLGDGQAWCMSLVQICIAFAEVMTGKVSKIPASESCAEVRRKCPILLTRKPDQSLPGFVWIWIYTATGLGHTGLFDEWVRKWQTANLFEGNTVQGLVNGKVSRDGGGCYETVREQNPPGMKLGMVIDPFPEG